MQNKTDGELIAQFAAGGQDDAFEELVRRHGPMVQSVCSRVLGHQCDGEDMTQVVFLILAQKATELLDRPSLAGWLHRVAWHTSLRARRSLLTRRRHERAAADAQVRARQQAERDRSLQLELDRVLNLVPEVYREPLVLHYLEGLSLEESAELMECPIGTVASRLARGREMLRERLERWGLGLTVATGGGLLLHEIGVEGFVATVVAPVGPVSAAGGMTAMGAVAERSTTLAVTTTSTAALTTAGVVGICTRGTVGVYGLGTGIGGSVAAGGYGLGAAGSYALATAGACGSLAAGIGSSSACAASPIGASAACGTSAAVGLGSLLKGAAGMVFAASVAATALGGAAIYQATTQTEANPSASVSLPERSSASEDHDSFRDFSASSGGSGFFGGTSSVPEPGSLAMLMASSLALLLRKRR